MKTLNKINLTILISILSLTAFAGEFKLKEEAYINDVRWFRFKCLKNKI